MNTTPIKYSPLSVHRLDTKLVSDRPSKQQTALCLIKKNSSFVYDLIRLHETILRPCTATRDSSVSARLHSNCRRIAGPSETREKKNPKKKNRKKKTITTTLGFYFLKALIGGCTSRLISLSASPRHLAYCYLGHEASVLIYRARARDNLIKLVFFFASPERRGRLLFSGCFIFFFLFLN